MSLFMKDNFHSPLNKKPEVGGCFTLSILEFFNIITLWLLFDLKNITASYYLDMVLCFGLLYALNYLIFLRKKRYKTIFSKLDETKEFYKTMGLITSIVYFVGTIFLFYYVHHNQVVLTF